MVIFNSSVLTFDSSLVHFCKCDYSAVLKHLKQCISLSFPALLKVGLFPCAPDNELCKTGCVRPCKQARRCTLHVPIPLINKLRATRRQLNDMIPSDSLMVAVQVLVQNSCLKCYPVSIRCCLSQKYTFVESLRLPTYPD